MQWFEIQIKLPLSLLESTYNFLWLFVHGITVEKNEKDFLVMAYLCAPHSDNITKRLNNFIHIQAKSFQTKYKLSVTEITGQYNLILANLYGAFLKEIASSLVQRLSPQGFIVLGDMTIAQIEPVLSVFIPYGLKKYRRYFDEQWGVVVLQR
jgi:hypothetical protein